MSVYTEYIRLYILRSKSTTFNVYIYIEIYIFSVQCVYVHIVSSATHALAFSLERETECVGEKERGPFL